MRTLDQAFSRTRLVSLRACVRGGPMWKWAAYSFTSMTLWSLFGASDMVPNLSSTPVPDDKQAYVGHWSGRGMELEMTREGKVRYVRRKGPTSKSVMAQLRKFEGDDFEAGVWVLAQGFKVSEPPTYRDGHWTMTVNGVRLLRSR